MAESVIVASVLAAALVGAVRLGEQSPPLAIAAGAATLLGAPLLMVAVAELGRRVRRGRS